MIRVRLSSIHFDGRQKSQCRRLSALCVISRQTPTSMGLVTTARCEGSSGNLIHLLQPEQ